jgi:hypothetical protein
VSLVMNLYGLQADFMQSKANQQQLGLTVTQALHLTNQNAVFKVLYILHSVHTAHSTYFS